ncbi:MAG: hypothetical protein ACRYFU_10210, partial [Janthinobacterium lividum]
SDYIDDLVFVDSFDPNWSVYFENENAAKTALKLSLERLAALNVSDGEPAPPPPKPQSFRSLIDPIEGVLPATGPSIVSSAYAGLTFRERWRAARQEDKGLLRWVAAWGLLLIGYYYCRAVGGPGFKQLDTFFTPISWLSFIYVRWFRDGKLRASASKAWLGLRNGRITSQSIGRALLKWWRGVMLR